MILVFAVFCSTSIKVQGSRLLYDRKEAARQISVSVRSLDYLIAGKQLETRRIGKKVLVTHASLVRFSRADHFKSPKEIAESSRQQSTAEETAENQQ